MRSHLEVGETYCNDGAGGAVVSAWWDHHAVGFRLPDASLGAHVVNRLGADVHARVELRSSALEGQTVTRPLFEALVPANSQLDLGIGPADISVRSSDSLVRAELVTTVLSVGEYEGVKVTSRPIHLMSVPGGFDLFGEAPPPPDPPVLRTPATQAEAAEHIATAVGTLRGAGSAEYLDSTTLLVHDLRTLARPGDAYHVLERGVRLSPADSATLGTLFTPITPAPPDPAFAPVRVCAQWPASFHDEGRGESFVGPYPASYAEARFGAAHSFPWVGYLDADGCTPPLSLANGTGYELTISTRLKKAGTTMDIVSAGGAADTFAAGFSTLVVQRPASSPPVTIRVALDAAESHETRVAAVASAALARQGDVGMPPGRFVIHANARCQGNPSGPSACAATNQQGEPELYIGSNDGVDEPHNSYWKFVVAHEIGHGVHHLAGALPHAPYNANYSSTEPGYCGCAFVANPNDRSHCLGSQEFVGVANGEGFAHYFAARVLSGDNPEACTYVYYKNFNDPVLGIAPPPLARSCAAPVQWMDTHCWANNRGTEWDWANFLRATAVGSNAIPLGDLLAVQRRACGGNCSGQQPDFQALLYAAQQEFGVQSPRAERFALLGPQYGINH